MNFEFFRQIFEKYLSIRVIKIRPLVAQFLADRQTEGWREMKKLIVAFQSFVKAPKNW